jgi:lipoyl(octanoyl) transferase
LRAPIIKQLGLIAFEPTWRAMQAANKSRTPETPDEIWLLEHPPVFTLGLAGKPEHLLAPGNIPVVKTDRGGQVTYHGPGQLVVYMLLDLKRLGFGVKELVKRIEQSVIDLLAEYGIESARMVGMPGVYVKSPSRQPLTPEGGGASFSSLPPRGGGAEGEGEVGQSTTAKIAAIGLRVANHATFHGLSINIDMDLEPFSRINPCGYEGLAVTQMKDCGADVSNKDKMQVIGDKLVKHLSQQLYGTVNG